MSFVLQTAPKGKGRGKNRAVPAARAPDLEPPLNDPDVSLNEPDMSVPAEPTQPAEVEQQAPTGVAEQTQPVSLPAKSLSVSITW